MKRSLIGALCVMAVAGGTFAQAPKKPAPKAPAQVAPVEAAEAKDAATLEFEKFRAEMEESNPAELFEMKGEEQWKTRRGPKNVSLAESCDLGQGVGKVEGAYVRMPRYFADADAVMDASGASSGAWWRNRASSLPTSRRDRSPMKTSRPTSPTW